MLRFRFVIMNTAKVAGLFLLLSAAAPPSTGPPAEAFSSALATWSQQAEQLRKLKDELNTLDVLSDPDRDEQYWWNPFWRWSRENQAQRATEVALKIQELKNRQRDLDKTLQPLSRALADWARERSAALSPEEAHLWRAADAWSIPRLLEEPDWEALDVAGDSPADQELLARRIRAFSGKQREWLALQAYLSAYLNQPDPAATDQYQAWQTELKANLEKLSRLLQKLKPRIQTRPDQPTNP